MTSWTIIPVRLGTMTVPYAQLVRGGHSRRLIDIPCIAWVLRGPDGDLVVDTGPADADWSRKHHNPMVRPRHESVPAAFGNAGIDIDQVEIVVNTHLHWDHCYGNVEFDRARFFIQERELAYARQPLPCDEPVYETTLASPFESVADRFVAVDGEAEVAPGIRLVPLPGHTPGHQGVLVRGRRRTILIGGDAVGLYDNLTQPWRPGTIYTDLHTWYDSLTRLYDRCDLLLPGHDPAVFLEEAYT